MPQSDPQGINAFFLKLQQTYWDLAQQHPPASPSSFTTSHLTSTKVTDEIGVLRNKIAGLDETVHHQVLLSEALRRALKTSEDLYISLKTERTRLISEVNLLSRHARTNGGTRKSISLCTEILLEICSYLSKDDFDSVFQVWGELAYKAIPVEHTPSKSFSSVRRTFSPNSRTSECLNNQVSKGLWRSLSITGSRRVSQQDLFNVVGACNPHLAVVKHIELKRPLGVRGTYQCLNSECLHQIRAPACTRLTLPLTLLPCMCKVNDGGIRHLDVNLMYHQIRSQPEFVLYFRNFDITNLTKLTIRNSFKFAFSEIAGSVLMAPNLRIFTAHDQGTTESHNHLFIQFLETFECPNLEALEYFGSISIRVRPGELRQWRSLALFFEDLYPGSKEDGQVPFPCMSHLAVSCPNPFFHFDKIQSMLRQLLEKRERVGAAPIRTIELVIDQHFFLNIGHAQRLLIDQLGLHLHTLVITPNSFGFEDFDRYYDSLDQSSDDDDDENNEDGGF